MTDKYNPDIKALWTKVRNGEELTKQELYWGFHRAAQLHYQVEKFKKREQESPEWQAAQRAREAWAKVKEPQVIGEKLAHADCREWVIVLNKYQRDNLLWLFAAIGYATDANGKSGVEPFTYANNGDWVGEIPQMLTKPEQPQWTTKLEPDDLPNGTLEDLEKRINDRFVSPIAKLLASYISAEDWVIILTKANPQLRKMLADIQKTDNSA